MRESQCLQDLSFFHHITPKTVEKYVALNLALRYYNYTVDF